jgi:colanic acid/amylovoran biosynthesis glycosyltransferase
MNRAPLHQSRGPQKRECVLVYRDRLAPRSEAQFLRRQYIGFGRLTPVWVGRRTDEGLTDLGVQPVILGRSGALGVWDRFSFTHFGTLPAQPDLQALRPSIVHAQFGRGGALALPIARALDIPLVVTFHGGDATKDKHYARSIFPTVFQRRMVALQREAAMFICVSQFIRDQLAERGFPQEKLRVIRIGVDIDAEHAKKPPDEPPYVVFVGRFVEKKGIAHLLEAARMLAAEGSSVRFVLIGDGPLAGQLEHQARGLHNVVFPGWLPSQEVRRYMRGSIALCAPSIIASSGDAEGLPSVIPEAMADGIPVIASQQAGIAEAVEHGATGLLVPPAEPRALAEAIRALVDQPDLRRTLAIAARRVAHERFDAASQSRLLEQALLEIIQRQGAEGSGADDHRALASPRAAQTE